MGLLVLGYLLVPIALIYMVRNYKSTNWLWAGFLVASVFIGIAPFVAIAYLITLFLSSRSTKRKGDANAKVVKSYNTDGSYVVYDASSVKSAPSTGRVAFKMIGGIVAGITIAFGLLIVGIILLFTLFPQL